jgi:hypothetical protein
MNALRLAILSALVTTGLIAAEPAPRPVALRSALASSTYGDFPAANAIDGVSSDSSRWTSGRTPAGPWWLEVELSETTSLLGVHVHTGLNAATAVRGLTVQFRRDGQWVDIPSATVVNNQATALALAFDDAVAVRAMLERALGRAAYADEVERLAALVASERARYAGRDELARTLAGRAAEGSADLARDAALVAAANVILNLDDFLTRS